MCEISVIMPVYNVENYLKDCLDSVSNQSFKDIEIICVNDGSTDNSLEILKNYQNSDNRIKIITQKNQGLGAARNIGIKNAKGKYIFFIDSDDCLDLNCLEKVHENIICNNSDMVLFKFQSFGGLNNSKKGEGFKIDKKFGNIDYSNFTFTYKDVKRYVLNSYYSACLKLYKKEFIDCNNFRFSENIFFEDVLFHVKVMLNASKISFVNENLYLYRLNDDSIINRNTKGYDIFKVINDVEDYLTDNDYINEFKTEFMNFKIAQILLYIISTNSTTYFEIAKEELSEFDIDEDKIEKRLYSDYTLLKKSSSFDDFIKAKNPKKFAIMIKKIFKRCFNG